MWAGMACVSASGGGAAELGIHGIHHVRTERRPAAIASAIINLLQSPSCRERIGSAAKVHVHREFGAERIALKMIAAYETAQARAVSAHITL